MEVTVAKSAGFCFGVKRAVDMVYKCAKESDLPVYTYGPIIHNEVVTGDFESMGVKVLDENTDLSSIQQGLIIIRSHGVSKKIMDSIEKCGLMVKDATCPFVKKIHNHVSACSKNGDTIIIIGNKNHPEVQGIVGWSSSERTFVIDSVEEAKAFFAHKNEKICIVSQTTYNYNKFQELVEIITQKGYDINVINTICDATHERQAEALMLAKKSDAMIVIGSLTSSNTQKLYEICKKECANTYYIQTIDDLDVTKTQAIHSVGITAGASTPNKLIEEVQKYVRNEL
ncbi:MAG: 4-hydroxy-3-methylbut-2-enyl diphosphate reductase [Lachnospiraceae bacterium]|nr:4-hydroxy-3-methylbut-2-enyl diphosphate reductase [Lachnospiraceae bacterium]